MSDEPETPDPLDIIDALQPFIEAVRGVVASFVTEGFTEEQARALAVKAITL